MRVVFMGTPEFAVPTLRALAQAHDIVAVYTRPDSVSRRGSRTHPSPVKEVAMELGLVVREPTTLRDVAVQRALAADAPDAIIVAAYGLILPREVLSIPRHGCINVHASLLPRWRGAAPIQRAILAGDSVTGVSIMKMEEGLDTGPYCKVTTVEIAEKTAPQLTEELSAKGAIVLIEALQALSEESCQWADQVDADATYAAKIEKAEVALDPALSADDALRRVRASSTQAPARASLLERNFAVVAAERADGNVGPSHATVDERGLLLGFVDGSLLATRVKPEGKAEMPAADWTRGLRLDESACWASAR